MFRRGNKSRWGSGGWGSPVPVLFVFLIVVLLGFTLLFQYDGRKGDSPIGLVKQKWNGFESLVQLSPTVEAVNGTDLVWQIPESPKAVLFLAHGCGGRALNFWDRSQTCPDCVGLPEERLIVLEALSRKFAVIAISSRGRCWSFGEERMIIGGIIKRWVAKHSLDKLPLVALGASSGGYFVSLLATDLRVSSVVVMIAEGFYDQMDINKDYPPTLFVHMPKDEARKQRIDLNIRILKDEGIDVAEIKCMEFPLSPNFLADRIPGLGESISTKLFGLLQEKSFIDKNGYMRADGRAIHLKAALKKSKIVLPDKGLFHHIQEELNLAYAYHEMTSLQSEKIFKWCESHMS